MKKSIMVAIAILALGAVPGFFQQQRLSALREDHRKLAAAAVKLGLSLDSAGVPSDARLTKRQREDREKHALATGAELIALARELEAHEKGGGKPDDGFQKRAMETMVRLLGLDAAQLKRVIGQLRDDQGISGKTRGDLIAFSMMMLAEDHPEAAVALYAESSDLLDESMLGDHVISSALSRWAEISPNAALEWIRKNGDHSPEVAGDDAKRGVLAGIALNDPTLAFSVLDELKFEDAGGAIEAIVMSGNENPERRDAILAALRGHLAGIQSDSERDEIAGKALEAFARNSDNEGFDSLSGWLSEAGFTAEEKQHFAGGLSYFTTKGDTGRWIDWMSGNLPAESLGVPVRELVGEWTQEDYLAAGKWLSGSPDGPAKTAAVEAYAEAVAEYEPQVAAQWALTLPPGPGRDSTLRAIYQNWPAGDAEGAAAFAREHGLK